MNGTKYTILVKGEGAYLSLFNDIPGVRAIDTNNKSNHRIHDLIKECDAICITGGSDVNPILYSHTCNNTTHYNNDRDRSDIDFVEAALKAGKRIVGICRGAQLLCVIAGGTLVQDVSDHASISRQTHDITTDTGEEFEVTSTHHQMMHPVGAKSTRLAWAKGLSKHYKIGAGRSANMDYFKSNDVIMEPEVVWFPDLLGLAVQYHPERMSNASRGKQYFYELLWKYILN